MMDAAKRSTDWVVLEIVVSIINSVRVGIYRWQAAITRRPKDAMKAAL
tara:strand:+ start:880 stop:1023 length:144 start_codon:yes stop_codon:yes gene_type:complete